MSSLLLNQIFRSNSQVKNGILFIKTDAIGDFVLWLSVYRYYINNDVKIILNKQNYELATYCGINQKNLIVFEDKIIFSPIKFIKFILNLKNIEFDICVNSCSGRSLWPSDVIALLTNAKYKIGSNYLGGVQTKMLNLLSKNIYDAIEKQGTENDSSVIITHAAILEKIIEIQGLEQTPKTFTSSTQHKEKKKKNFVISIIPGASKKFRRWDEENFSNLLINLNKKIKIKKINLLGSREEINICNNIEVSLKKNNISVENTAGKSSIIDFIEIISVSDFVVTNETSAAHIGPYLHVPTFIILGGGHFGKFVPAVSSINNFEYSHPIYFSMTCFNCNWNCKYKYEIGNNNEFPCIENISVNDVEEKIFSYFK